MIIIIKQYGQYKTPKMPSFQFLGLHNCILEDGSRLRRIDLPRLQHLELINSATCFRFDSGFATVRRLYYSMDRELSRLCRNLTMLEDLDILLLTRSPVADEIRTHFRSLAELPNLHTLRLCGMKTNTRPWDFCLPMPTIRRLVLRKCYFLRVNFPLLPKLFPQLRVLELEDSIIGYRQLPDGVDPMAHLRWRLKQFLPANCYLVVHPTTRAHPLDMVLLMQNDRKWKEHTIKAYGAKYEVWKLKKVKRRR